MGFTYAASVRTTPVAGGERRGGGGMDRAVPERRGNEGVPPRSGLTPVVEMRSPFPLSVGVTHLAPLTPGKREREGRERERERERRKREGEKE